MTLLVVLAGGRGRRLGQVDKALVCLGGRTLLQHVFDRMRLQATGIAINANGEAARFAGFGCPVLPDPIPGQVGPLAGILAAMQWAASRDASHVATVPVDTPFLPLDLLTGLQAARDGEAPAGAGAAVIAMARSAERIHPVTALWPTILAGELAEAIGAGARRVEQWAAQHRQVFADFAAGRADPVLPDPFLNINTEADLQHAARRLR